MASHVMPWRMFLISSIYGNFAEIKESYRNPMTGALCRALTRQLLWRDQ